ncbi:beta-lactamase family protein [Sphingomonas sp. So64.6b]|uniref:serine hydrolase domain-containing protein n=1 Tax=Sphingomonas sp. So64.6b TaxID=2997354 RepID=UPI0016038DBA|nr:serine hydrolase domain-containing protein [Sphingomonas sp. So64.6b]QNA84261.1 beta-lactamase family protein [Sphingomonas sp. So64.6b]
MTPRPLFARPLLTLALLTAAPAAYAQALTPAETTQVDTLVTKTLAKTGVPSASIAIVRCGEIVFAKAYGKQSETMKTANTDAPYQIASVSKQFTAAALLLLENEGKLSLDDKVSKYVPGITGGDTIALRQLLSHTSGLQDYWPQDYSFKAMATPVTPQGIVDRWAKKPLDFAPGEQWQYSNTGYVVAGMIVEKVAGEPLLSYLDRKIFKPLGIKAIDQDLAIGKTFPQGYGRNALGPVRVTTPAAAGWLFAAGELAMSARDLAKWNVARLNRSILPAEDWAAQETAVRLTDGSTNGYGLGVSTGTANGRRYVEHSGEAVGFLSENIVYPDDKAAVTVLTNTWSSDAFTQIAQDIVKTILPPPPADAADTAAATKVRAVFDQLRGGTLDRSQLTEDADFYFTPVVLADFKASLAPLGETATFVQTGKARLRGGFVNRNYRVTYAEKTLSVSTYAEPGDGGRIEQFLVNETQK